MGPRDLSYEMHARLTCTELGLRECHTQDERKTGREGEGRKKESGMGQGGI